jgi:phasin family protein
MFTNEQYTAAANVYGKEFKANVEAAFVGASGIAQTGFSGFEKMMELNLAATKMMFDSSIGAAQKSFGAKDPQEFIALNSAMAQPAFESGAAYVKKMYEIAAGTNGAIVKEVEAHAQEAQRTFVSQIDKASKQVPGSEPVFAAVKTAMSAANTAYDQFAKTVKQAVEMTEANVGNATKQATAAVKTAVKGKK